MSFSEKVIDILNKNPLGYVGTVDEQGVPNISLKGIIDFDADYNIIKFLDLYCKNTHDNLKLNPNITVVVVDIDNFTAFQFKGTAEIVYEGPEFDQYVVDWELEKHNRFRQRINFNLKKYLEPTISEYNLPKPKYLVKVHVQIVEDLSPKPGKPATDHCISQ